MFDHDFTADSATSYSTDGTYTIAGISAKMMNMANVTTTTQIVNGTGLQFYPNAASSFGSRTAPSLLFPLTTLYSGADYWTKWRILTWWGNGTHQMPYVSNHFIAVGFDNGTTSNVLNIGFGPSYFGVLDRTIQSIINGSGTNESSSANTGDTVYQFEVPYGLQRRAFFGSTLSTYSSGWGLGSFYNPGVQWYADSGSVAQNATQLFAPIANMSVIVAPNCGAGTAGMIATLKRMRIDYCPGP